MCPCLDPSLSNVGSNLLCQLPLKRHRHQCAMVTLETCGQWCHTVLCITSPFTIKHTELPPSYMPLLVSDIPHFSIWCLVPDALYWSLCLLLHCPIVKERGHSSQSLTQSPSQLQDGKPDGAAKLFSSREKGSSSHAGGSGKSEVNSISTITTYHWALCWRIWSRNNEGDTTQSSQLGLWCSSLMGISSASWNPGWISPAVQQSGCSLLLPPLEGAENPWEPATAEPGSCLMGNFKANHTTPNYLNTSSAC